MAIVTGRDSVVSDSVLNDTTIRDHIVTPDVLSADSDANRALFQSFFTKFVKAVRQNDKKQLVKLIHFPIQAAEPRTPNNLEYYEVDSVEDLIQQSDFYKYYPNIFYPELRRQFRTVHLDEVNELEGVDGEGYYRTLHNITDKGAPMFELYAQWTYTDEGLAGSFFGFVFGKVDGEYKMLSYYGKWPAKL